LSGSRTTTGECDGLPVLSPYPGDWRTQLIVDSHVHVFPPELIRKRQRLLAADQTFAEMFADPAARMATADELVEEMDEGGVDVSIAMGIGWADPGLARESNDYIAEAASRHSSRILGFGVVNPALVGAAAEIERCAELGLRGIGELHPDTQGFDVSDPAVMDQVLQAVRAKDLALTVHCSEPVGHAYPGKGRNTPDKVMGLVGMASGVRLVLAHWGGGLPFYALMPEIAESLSDVYFDTAASPYLYDARVFEMAASIVGPDRIMAASDYPLMPFERVRGQIEASGLSEVDSAKVLGENAARLFGLSPGA
jgi:predicted TIM-barrel fold metal-dependent hydrolase